MIGKRQVGTWLTLLALSAPAFGQEADAPDGPAQAEADPAEDTSDPIDIVTVAASRGAREDLDAPASVTVLDEDAIRQRHAPRSFPDLVHDVPGVHTQETGPAQGSPLVRGLTGYHVLTLIDGIRLNGSFFRSGPNQYSGLIDPFTIATAEVVRGPGSVLYGSDALGGVLALRTRDPVAPKDTEDGAFWVRPGAALRYGQPLRDGASVATQPRLEFMAGRGPVSALVGFDIASIGDREGGQDAKTLGNTDYTQLNGDAKVVARPTETERVTLAFQWSELRNGPRTHSTAESESYRGTTVGSDRRRDLSQERQLLYLQAETKDRAIFDRLKGSVSLQRQYENQRRIRSSGATTRSGFDVYALGAFAEAETDLDLLLEPTLSYGFDYTHEFVESFQNGLPRGPIADDSDYDLFGAYLRLELHFGAWVDFYAGFRYSIARVVARQVDPDPLDAFPFERLDETYQAPIGSTGLTIHLTDGISLVGSASQGFRAPNLDDTTAFRAVSSSAFDSPSPKVDPERSLTLEAGLKWSSDWFRGQVFYAYTFLEDFIQRVPTGNTVNGLTEFTKANFSDGSIQAIDGQAQVFVSPLLNLLGLEVPDVGLSVRGRFSWTRGHADALIGGVKQTDHLRRIPPARFSGALLWEMPETRWLWVEVEGEFVLAQHRLSVGDIADTQRIPPGGSPAYTLWHARVGVTLFDDVLKASVGVENLCDRDYRVHGSGTNGYGRTLVVALEALW